MLEIVTHTHSHTHTQSLTVSRLVERQNVISPCGKFNNLPPGQCGHLQWITLWHRVLCTQAEHSFDINK